MPAVGGMLPRPASHVALNGTGEEQPSDSSNFSKSLWHNSSVQQAALHQQDEQIKALQTENKRLKADLEKLRAMSSISPLLPRNTTILPVDLRAAAELQYEEVILMFTIVGMVLVWSLPLVRPFRRCCETRVHNVYPSIALVNLIVFGIVLNRLYLISVNMVFFWAVAALELVITQLEQVLIGFMGIVVLLVAWKFKDRILEAIGVEDGKALIGEPRDWLTCWSMRRFQTMELLILKVEGLPAAKLYRENAVFCEVTYGYNVDMKTRVHHGAGHKCSIRETVQINFDPVDYSRSLRIYVKDQDIVGNSEIASVQLSTTQINRLNHKGKTDRHIPRTVGCGVSGGLTQSPVWAPSRFEAVELVPAGRVYIRFELVSSEEGVLGRV